MYVTYRAYIWQRPLSISCSKSVARIKQGLLQSALIFRLRLLLHLRHRGDTITITIIITIDTTGTMKYLRHVGNIITRKTPVDPATVPFHIVEPPWNQPVIVCWTRRTDIIIVRPLRRRRAPHNLLPDSTVVPWKTDATKAEL